jgi:16S rRNA processing protein RimM
MQAVAGRVGKPHGVRGEVTVEIRTDQPGTRFRPGAVLATEPAERGPLTVAGARWERGRLLLRFAGIDERDHAELLRGTLLLVEATAGGQPDPNSYHDTELIGLEVVTTDGEPVGRVSDVEHHGQDLLIVQSTDAEVLIPFVAEIVPRVDVATGRLVVDPPPGLLELR